MMGSGDLVVEFPCSTTLGGKVIGALFPCSEAIAGEGAAATWISQMQCMWQAPTTLVHCCHRLRRSSFRLLVPPFARVPNAICPTASCTIAGVCADPEDNHPVETATLAQDPAPSVTVSAPSVIGSCDALELAATVSARPRTLVWNLTATSASSGAPLLVSELASLSSAPGEVPAISPSLGAPLFPSELPVSPSPSRPLISAASAPAPCRSPCSARPIPCRLRRLCHRPRYARGHPMRIAAVVAPDACATAGAPARSLSYSWSLARGDSGAVVPPRRWRDPRAASKHGAAGSDVDAQLDGYRHGWRHKPLNKLIRAPTPALEPIVATILGGSERRQAQPTRSSSTAPPRATPPALQHPHVHMGVHRDRSTRRKRRGH